MKGGSPQIHPWRCCLPGVSRLTPAPERWLRCLRVDPAPGKGELSGHFWALLAVDGFLYFLPGLWVLKSILTVLFLFLRFSAAGGLLSGALCYVPASLPHPPGDLGPSLALNLSRTHRFLFCMECVPMWFRGAGTVLPASAP